MRSTTLNNTHGIARIVRPAPGGALEKHIGMAFIVDKRHVMTCCHVLNDALGRKDRLDSDEPPRDKQFAIRFPYADDARGVGVVAKWGLALSWPVDVAVLKLEREVPIAAGVACFSDDEVRQTRWSCIGWDEDGVDREVQGNFGSMLARSELQLNGQDGVAARIVGGYSGSAVWSDRLKAFAGMVTTKDRSQFENGLAYAIPTRVLSEVWTGLQPIDPAAALVSRGASRDKSMNLADLSIEELKLLVNTIIRLAPRILRGENLEQEQINLAEGRCLTMVINPKAFGDRMSVMGLDSQLKILGGLQGRIDLFHRQKLTPMGGYIVYDQLIAEADEELKQAHETLRGRAGQFVHRMWMS